LNSCGSLLDHNELGTPEKTWFVIRHFRGAAFPSLEDQSSSQSFTPLLSWPVPFF